MRRKKWLLLILIVFVTSAANAQFRFGIRGGYNIATVKFNKDVLRSDNTDGFQVGPVFEFMFDGPVGIETGIFYARKGFFTENNNFTNDYLEVPVNLKLKLDLPAVSHYFAAGPYVGFRVDGDKLRDIVNVNNVKGQLEAKSFAAGLNFTAGVELFSRIQVGLTYDWGLTDNYKTFDINNVKEYSGKAHTWLISATLMF